VNQQEGIMDELNNFRVAMLATDGFEETELTEPKRALESAGARVDVIAPKPDEIQAFRHHDKSITVPVDRTLDEVRPGEYDAVMLPGGALNADALRVEPKLKQFLRAMWESGRPFAAICHAPWELVSAGLAEGRRLTSYHTIQDDLKNAGADWVDEEVVVDGQLVTSRQPDDLPAFNREMLRVFAKAGTRAGTKAGARG
jgi:protease I